MKYKAGYKVVNVVGSSLTSAFIVRGRFEYYIGQATISDNFFGPMGVFDEIYYALHFRDDRQTVKSNLQIWHCIYKESLRHRFYQPEPLRKVNRGISAQPAPGTCFADEVVLIKPYNYQPPREIRKKETTDDDT